MTVVSDYRSLLSNDSWSPTPGVGIILTYSFSTAPTTTIQNTVPGAVSTFHPLTDAEKATVQGALAQWSAASGITFEQTTSTPGDITFGFYDLSTITSDTADAGLGNYPFTGTYIDASGTPQVYSNFIAEGGDVYFDNSYQTNPAFTADFAHVAIHEIGHALGLKHPFDSNSSGPSYTLTPVLDNGSETVMAYAGLRSPTLEPLDIAAIQYLYGTPTGASHPYSEVWNAATEALTITGGNTAQAIFGSGGNDVFYSTAAHDALSGGEGDDLFYASGKPISVNGGTGSDTVVTGLAYSAASMPVQGTGSAFRYVYLPSFNDFQTYVNVATLDFTNGVYSTASNSFTTYDSVASPGTTNPDVYSLSGTASTDWGNAANWHDSSSALTLLPPGLNNSVSLGGSAVAAAPRIISGIGNAAATTITGGAIEFAGGFYLGALSIAGALTLASGQLVRASTLSLSAASAIAVDPSATLDVGGFAGRAGALTVEAGASFTNQGGTVGGTVLNSGTVTGSGTITGNLAGSGALRLGTGTTTIGGTLGAEAVSFTGTGQTLRVHGLSGAASLSGFQAGDVFDVAGGATPTLTGNTLSTATGSVMLAAPVVGQAYALQADGTGGSQLALTAAAPVGAINFTDAVTGVAGVAASDVYTGPVSYLQRQYIWTGTDGVALAATTPNVFLKGGPGGDALLVNGGSNVLDGGGGSNFLIGGSGTDGGADTFFVDSRGGTETWSTIVNFHQGDAATIFGFHPGLSTRPYTASDGATGYKGLTIHSEINGAGTGILGSMTFTGISQATADAHFSITTGTLLPGTAGAIDYLLIQYNH